MKNLRTLFIAGLGLALAGTASAAGGSKHAEGPEGGFPFEGPLGKFEMDSVQRGFQVYREVCASCHG
ncbi:MAG: cytochrome c1, partial [Pseudomonadota bacterium]